MVLIEKEVTRIDKNAEKNISYILQFIDIYLIIKYCQKSL